MVTLRLILMIGTLLIGIGSCQQNQKKLSEMELHGHRGWRGAFPENSIVGFIQAMGIKVDVLELDVVVSKDGEVVVSHEPWMSSLICTQPSGESISSGEESKHNIYTMTYDSIARYDCGSRDNTDFPLQAALRAAKPLLNDVFDICDAYADANQLPKPKFNVEIKYTTEGDGIYHPSADEFISKVLNIVTIDDRKMRTTIQCFDADILKRIHKIDPQILLSLLVDNDLGVQANLARLDFTPSIYSPHFMRVNADDVSVLQSKGIRVIPWTVNELSDMAAMGTMGVDGVITDYPKRFQKLSKKE